MFSFFRRSIIARLLGIGAVAIVCSGAQYSCSANSDDENPFVPPREIDSGQGENFTTTLVLRDSAGTEKSTFSRGELITLELTVRNRKAEPVTIQLSSPGASDFFVFRGGQDDTAWNCTHGRAFIAIVVPLTFAANETKVISCTWDQVLPDGGMASSGNFEARGAIMAVGVFAPTGSPLTPHELASGFKAFRIQ
jgi:Intracellular proteinase inhibitor